MREPRLDQLVPPPPRPSFDTELWERIEAAERASARRWRTVAVVAVVVAIAGATGAGVLAIGSAGSVTIDRTLSCQVSRNGEFDLFAHVRGPATFVHEPGVPGGSKLVPHPALVELDTNRSVYLDAGLLQVVQTTLAGAYAGTSMTQKAGYTLDGSGCLQAKPIPLTPAELRSAGVFTGSQAGGVYRACFVAQPATVRVRITLSRSGLPTVVRLAVRGGKKHRPVAYVEWTPKRVRAWLASGCRLYTQLAP